MVGDSISILCTGDVHLGRHPTRIPSDLDGRQFSPTAVWQEIVETARRREIDLVALTGDVVDRENRYFEAYGAVEEGIQQLAAADIPTVAVAGNHDYDVFPRLVEELDVDALHLLGADGTWQRGSIELAGGRTIHLDGWSFPRSHVYESPLDAYDLEAAAEPTLGLIHADVSATTSEYAPVELDSLLETDVDGWLLGHIHQSRVHNESDPFVCYPGSPQPLDPGERAGHGPWLLEVDESGSITAEQLPSASLRYDRLEIDVTGATDTKALPSLIREHLETEFADAATGTLELLLVRLTLTGRTEAHTEIHDRAETIVTDLGMKLDGTDVRIESIAADTQPAIDLPSLADGDSPAAYLAALLLSLEEGDHEEYEDVLDDALDAMRETHQASAYRELRQEDFVESPTRQDAIEMVRTQARLLLDELQAQREGTP